MISINIYADIFDLFRPTRGRNLPVYGGNASRYVPENFDVVLPGSSVSENLDTLPAAMVNVPVQVRKPSKVKI